MFKVKYRFISTFDAIPQKIMAERMSNKMKFVCHHDFSKRNWEQKFNQKPVTTTREM